MKGAEMMAVLDSHKVQIIARFCLELESGHEPKRKRAGRVVFTHGCKEADAASVVVIQRELAGLIVRGHTCWTQAHHLSPEAHRRLHRGLAGIRCVRDERPRFQGVNDAEYVVLRSFLTVSDFAPIWALPLTEGDCAIGSHGERSRRRRLVRETDFNVSEPKSKQKIVNSDVNTAGCIQDRCSFSGVQSDRPQ